jgi:hypothetical protein
MVSPLKRRGGLRGGSSDLRDAGVRWRPRSETRSLTCDLCIAVHQPELLGFVKTPKRTRHLWPVNQLKHYMAFVLVRRASGAHVFAVFAAPGSPNRYSAGPAGRGPRAFAVARLSVEARLFTSRPTLHLCESSRSGSTVPRVPEPVLDVCGVHDLRPGEDAWQVWQGSHQPASRPSARGSSLVPRAAVSRARA